MKTGRINGDTIQKQDFIAWISQGPISDRTGEHLTAVDQGVILYHKLLFENINRVEQGLDPMGIIRDPALNEIVTFGTLDDPTRQSNPVPA